jgi:DNA processing protein
MARPHDLPAWLRLLCTPGIGREGARRLLSSCGTPDAVFAAGPATLRELLGPSLASALAAQPHRYVEQLALTETWLDASPSHHVLTLGDTAYPASLLETADPPLLLYAQGRLDLLAVPALAVVGSRNPTAQGIDNARAFAEHISSAGVTIVSGMALGIDGAAHEGGLEGPGSTIAVVGTGLDRIYPARHKTLAHRIDKQGLLLSEFELGTPPLQENFPQRNRLIAGLARGTLVVEAALRSGSLITARQALEAGREVFAIPGSIHSPQSRGCHALIKQGAKLVDSADDILGELNWTAAPAPTLPAAEVLPGRDDALLRALGHDPVTLDALLARTGESAATVSARLLELELDGRVARLPGGLYQRRGMS